MKTFLLSQLSIQSTLRETQVYIGHTGEYHYVSTINILNLQCYRQGQVSNDCQNQQLVYAVRNNDEQAKEKQKATERNNIQSKGLNTAHTEKQNIKRQKIQPTSQAKQADKVTKCNAYMKQLMQKKQADAQFRWKENKRKREKAKTNVPNKGNTNSTTFNVAAAKLISSDNNNTSNNKIIDQFHKNIRCGPEFICTCCDQLWYRSSVTKMQC